MDYQSTLHIFPTRTVSPFRTQLLKWIGNKQKFAHHIVSHFPREINTYREPFLGSGAILATLLPDKAVGSDYYAPLIEIWQCLRNNPNELMDWYLENFNLMLTIGKKEAYDLVKNRFNINPNGKDLLFLSRSCYGGVIRFRKKDGAMSTPCGVHTPISPESFNKRVHIWSKRTKFADFLCLDYRDAFALAKKGDFIYCDPPYVDSQKILYGGQDFQIDQLYEEISKAVFKGVNVALSIDGTKKSDAKKCVITPPKDLFKREIFLSLGSSMLKRFQQEGKDMKGEEVKDRLLLTYDLS